jgi:predicted sulfurtransferase
MIGKGNRITYWMVAILVILAMGFSLAVASEKVPRMPQEQLKEMIGKPEVVILDVRSKSDWEKAQTKILGAIREDPNKPTKSWAEKYSKDKTIVLYCA